MGEGGGREERYEGAAPLFQANLDDHTSLGFKKAKSTHGSFKGGRLATGGSFSSGMLGRAITKMEESEVLAKV